MRLLHLVYFQSLQFCYHVCVLLWFQPLFRGAFEILFEQSRSHNVLNYRAGYSPYGLSKLVSQQKVPVLS